MKVGCWNIRGLNRPLKQNGVVSLMRNQQVDIMGVLESKLSHQKLASVMKNKFKGKREVDNFYLHDAGRIIVLWDPSMVHLEPIDMGPQVIHCKAKCKVTSITFHISFVYAFHSVVGRRPLWLNLRDFGSRCSGSWLVLGDFNCVMNFEEKCNGLPVSEYETKDLKDCCVDLSLSDLPSSGCRFTWSNNTVMSKLDRVLANNSWALEGLYGHVEFLPSGSLLDHSPGIVSILRPPRPRTKSFKFFNMWASHADFISLVEAEWQAEVEGSMQFILAKKLQNLKAPLHAFNIMHFSHISSRVEEELTEAHSAAQVDPCNVEVHLKVASLRKRAQFLKEAERLFYLQKAKCAHLKNSDKCTKFFYMMAKRNAKRNFIVAVSREDGSSTTSLDQIAEEFIGFFQNLLGTSSGFVPIDPSILNSGPLISQVQADGLVRDVNAWEIKEVLWSIGDDKAPSPDGFSACFFKKAWNSVGDQVRQAVQEFFSSSKLLKQFNHAAIVLIPKSSHASSMGEFRPIACCNVIYKVIAKILASRMEPLMDSIIDKAQAAFIQGRSLAGNIQLAQELLRKYGRKRSSPRCLIKVDLCKAYDSISWSFLHRVMGGLGFPPLFSGWVLECVSTTAYSLIINGSMCGFFKGKRGLRQGDPMSPFLFVLCLEYLSRGLNLATTASEFNFHPKCNKLKVSHLAFADDLMLFARGDEPSICIIMDCLRDFEEKSGLKALKSSIFTAGIEGHELQCIMDRVRFPQGAMPFRYLGIPLAAIKLKITHYDPLISKISDCIKAWQAVTFSYAGRLELIRGVLQGVVCFWLGILPIPVAVIEKIYGLCRRFLWCSKSSLVAWKDICLPKCEGGLGLKDLKCWNSCLLIKTLWDIHRKKNTLWVQWIHQEILQSGSIWQRQMRRDDSPLMKNLLLIRDKIYDATGSMEAAGRLIGSWSNGVAIDLHAMLPTSSFG